MRCGSTQPCTDDATTARLIPGPVLARWRRFCTYPTTSPRKARCLAAVCSRASGVRPPLTIWRLRRCRCWRAGLHSDWPILSCAQSVRAFFCSRGVRQMRVRRFCCAPGSRREHDIATTLPTSSESLNRPCCHGARRACRAGVDSSRFAAVLLCRQIPEIRSATSRLTSRANWSRIWPSRLRGDRGRVRYLVGTGEFRGRRSEHSSVTPAMEEMEKCESCFQSVRL